MDDTKEEVRGFDEPVDKAKKLIGLKQSAFKDYTAARILFLNSQLHQAALFANTCIEKELKACLYTFGLDVTIQHHSLKLLSILRQYDEKTFNMINSDFLKTLTKIYESRYHEGLNPGYNFVIIRRKFLAELDYTYQLLERKVRFKIKRHEGPVPKSLYEISVLNKLPAVVFDNYLYNNVSKEAFLSAEDDVYEFRMLFNHEVIDASYTIPTNADMKMFIYEALTPSNNNQSFTISNHHHDKIKNMMMTRNGILQVRKDN
jgi:HEPN domain-containing protein